MSTRTYPCCVCCRDDDPEYHASNPPDSHEVPCDACDDAARLAAERDAARKQAKTVTADQIEAAARSIYQAHQRPHVPEPDATWSWGWLNKHHPDEAERFRSLARDAFTAAGFDTSGAST